MEPRRFEEHLGLYVRSSVANARRMRAAVWWALGGGTASGVIAAGMLVYLFVDDIHAGPHPSALQTRYLPTAAGLLLVTAFVLLPMAVARFVQLIRRRGEWFAVYEKGFVHHTVHGDEVVFWPQVRKVWQRRGALGHGSVARALGTDYRCVIRCADRRAFRLNGLTDEAEWFARTVALHIETDSGKPVR